MKAAWDIFESIKSGLGMGNKPKDAAQPSLQTPTAQHSASVTPTKKPIEQRPASAIETKTQAEQHSVASTTNKTSAIQPRTPKPVSQNIASSPLLYQLNARNNPLMPHFPLLQPPRLSKAQQLKLSVPEARLDLDKVPKNEPKIGILSKDKGELYGQAAIEYLNEQNAGLTITEDAITVKKPISELQILEMQTECDEEHIIQIETVKRDAEGKPLSTISNSYRISTPSDGGPWNYRKNTKDSLNLNNTPIGEHRIGIRLQEDSQELFGKAAIDYLNRKGAQITTNGKKIIRCEPRKRGTSEASSTR